MGEACRGVLVKRLHLQVNDIMGVDIETLAAGDGSTFPKPGQKVTCHYVLTLQDGRKIDSSRDRGQPFQFNIGRQEVIGHGLRVWPRCRKARGPSSPSRRTWAMEPTGCPDRSPEVPLSSSTLSYQRLVRFLP